MIEDFELEELDGYGWGEDVEEYKEIQDNFYIASMTNEDFRIYINNKLDNILFYLKSFIDVSK